MANQRRAGLAAIILLGGLLNLARLAYPAALDAIAAIGLLLAIYEWLRGDLRASLAALWPRQRGERPYVLIWYAIVVAVMAFTIATDLVPQLYNLADDFQKYFAHAMRMVETGTLIGSPLNALGSETLGAQAFLQSFELAFLPGADKRSLEFLRVYQDAVQHGPIREEIAYFQAKIPAGEPVLAWISPAFLLDFGRNPIIDVNESGLATPWSKAPQPRSAQPQDYLTRIRAIGRRMGFVQARALEFRQRLEQLAPQADILGNEDGIVVMKPSRAPDRP